MKTLWNRLRHNQRGVAATEYMLMIAVIVIAVVVIGKKVFVDQFYTQGVNAAGTTVKKWLSCDPSINQNC
jgi:Flp pilus assembly pilin Flp